MEEERQYRMNPEAFRAASTGDLSYFEKDSNSNLLEVTPTPKKNTVLHVAVQFNQFEVAEKIVSLCQSLVLKENSKHNTPLHVASRVGTLSIVKLLIDKAKNVDVEADDPQQLLSKVNYDGDTALHVAVRYGNFDVVKELINENDPAKLAKKVNKDGESAMFLAVDRRHYDIASHIQRNAPDCSYAGRHRMNVLHALAFRKSDWPEVIFPHRRFLQGHLHVGKIPRGFMRAVMRNCPSAIEKRDNSGWTPLEIAAFIGNEKFVKLLIMALETDQKFNIAYSKNNEGLSALHIAAKEGNVEVMKELINKCPDIYELLDNMGRNALHVAAESGQSAAVNFFLDRPEFNGLINEQDKERNTPMHLAAIQEHFEIASQLLEHGKCDDLNSTNNDGLTAMDNLMLLGFRLTRELRVKLKDAQQSLRGVLLLKEMLDDSLNDPEVPADKSISDSKADGMENSDTKADGMKSISDSKADGMKNSNSKADGMKKSDTKAEIMMDSDSKADGMKSSDTKAESRMDSNTKADVMKNSNSKADRMKNSKADVMKNSNSKADRKKNSDSKAGRTKNSDSKEDGIIMTMANTDLVVATLITTVAFTAAFTVPGGYRSQGVDEGKAVLWKTKAFRVFQVANAGAFGLSISSVFCNYVAMTSFKIVRRLFQSEDYRQHAVNCTAHSILLLVVAFVSGTYTVVPHPMGMTLAFTVCCCFLSGRFLSLWFVVASSFVTGSSHLRGFIEGLAGEEKQESDEE